MNRNPGYYTIASLTVVFACGFLMQGVYGDIVNLSNQKCLTLTINPKRCDTVGASYCNSLSGCPSNGCVYCDSTIALPDSICVNSEGDTCPYNGQAATLCGNADNLRGKCKIVTGSGCTCNNPGKIGKCTSNGPAFPC